LKSSQALKELSNIVALKAPTHTVKYVMPKEPRNGGIKTQNIKALVALNPFPKKIDF